MPEASLLSDLNSCLVGVGSRPCVFGADWNSSVTHSPVAPVLAGLGFILTSGMRERGSVPIDGLWLNQAAHAGSPQGSVCLDRFADPLRIGIGSLLVGWLTAFGLAGPTMRSVILSKRGC